MFYALLISNVSFVFAHMNRGRANLKEKIWTVNEYMQAKKMALPIRDKVREFYKLQYKEGQM